MSRVRRILGKACGGVLFATAVVLLLSVAALASANQAAGGEAYSAFNGKVTYKVYCMNCHGVAGKGDGYLKDALKVAPSDLTAMAQRSGGNFPGERAWKAIDGREAVKLHGSREMPIWGDAFRWPADSPDKEAEAKRKIGELVEFLRSIQEKPAAK